MVSTKDVRIGNWLLVYNKPDIVKSIDTTVKWGSINKLGIRSWRGIVLTEEWLVKLGFVANPDHEHPSFDEFIHPQVKGFGIGSFDGEYWVIEFIDQGLLNTLPVMYVHQLQNIFYFTAGIELLVASDSSETEK